MIVAQFGFATSEAVTNLKALISDANYDTANPSYIRK
jgi:hypothetical protein